MFHSDQPIRTKKEDLLNRDPFAHSLAKAILSHESKESLTIGLYGEWGTGKTSLINIIIESLDELKSSVTSKPEIIRFNPWYFSDQNQLITQFFDLLRHTLKHNNLGKGAEVIADKIESYSSFFKPLKLIPGIGQYAGLIETTSKDVVDVLKTYSHIKETNIQDLYDELKSLLSEQKFKFIIVIDDIDRLNNTEIRQIFQLVKSIADFPNVVYILAFDKGVVVNALSKVQSGSGYDYLEKVIQVPFDIPKILESEIHTHLFNQLDLIIGEIVDCRWNPTYWGNVFHSGFKYLFKDFRDIRRYINTLKLSFDLIGSEVNIVDLFAIVAIQVFIPELYKGIKNNKDLFSGDLDSYDHSDREKKKESLTIRYNDITAGIDYLPANYLRQFLERIFPKLSSLTDQYFFGISDSSINWRKDLRLCSPEHFDNYFRLSISQEEISLNEIKEILKCTDNKEKLSQKIIELTNNGKITRLLERLEDYTREEIPFSNIENVIAVLMDLGDTFPEGEQGFYGFNNSMKILRICYQLIMRIKSKEERFNIFKNAIEYCDSSIYTIVHEVSVQGQQHGKYDTSKSHDYEQTTTLELLGELENLTVKKLNKWAKSRRLIDHPKLIAMLYAWKRMSESEEANIYINNLIRTNKGLLQLIKGFSGKTQSYSMGDYVPREHIRVNIKDIGDFIDIAIATKRLRKIQNSKLFVLYTDEDKNIINIFLNTIDGKIKNTI